MSQAPQIVLASGNAGKLRELTALLADAPLQVMSIRDFPTVPEPDEPHDSFVANALHKARYYHRALGLSPSQAVLADDSGLCVDALGGAPGVYSAHFAGEPRSDERNNIELLRRMASYCEPSERGAHFVCVLALVRPSAEYTYQGEVHGHLALEISGNHGFGYDVLFVPTGYDRTFGELDDAIKQRISHRAQALRQLVADLCT